MNSETRNFHLTALIHYVKIKDASIKRPRIHCWEIARFEGEVIPFSPRVD